MPLSKLTALPQQLKITFLSSFISGYLIHLYAFTNVIPNSDGINRVYDLQQMTVSGRWFLEYATLPHGAMQMPAFIAFLSLLLLSFSATLITDLLEIKSKPLAGALGISFISFPSVGFTYLYMFTASAYSIGIFLAIFSVWLGNRGKQSWFFAVIALALSMGIYQAYAAFSIGLCVIVIIKKTNYQQLSQKEVTVFGMKCLAFLASGAFLYYFLLKLILLVTGQELLQYLGMEQSYPFSQIPSLILASYKQVISFFFISGTGTTTNILILFNCVTILLGLAGLFYLIIPFATDKQYWRVFYILALCCILPLALGFSQLISPWSIPTPLMQYPYVLAYSIVLFFVDIGMLRCPVKMKQTFAYTSTFSFFLITLGSAWLCNLLYTASAQAHRATESYVTRIMTQIEMTEGFQWGMPILVIGAFPEERFYADIEAYSLIDHYAAPVNSVLPLNKHIYYYFNHWLHLPIEEPSEESMISMSKKSEFQDMPLYPDFGSVQIIENQVVVKISENYLPKSDYEIAYENRK